MDKNQFFQKQKEREKNAIKNMLKITQETQKIGQNTNQALYYQGKKIDNIHDKNKDLTKEINKADKTSKKLTSFWYRVKQAVKDYVMPNRNTENDTSSSAKEQINNNQNTQKYSNGNKQTNNNYNAYQYSNKNKTHDQQIDEGLDEVSKKLENIKNLAKDAGKQLDRHNQVINKIDQQMDKNNEKIHKINHRLNKKFL